MKTLLRTLTEIPAPSGREDALRAAVREHIQPHVDEIRVDALGNLIARKGTKAKNGKRVMLAAHLDEIGLIVSHVDERGFARFSSLGGVFPRHLPGGRVRFLNGAHGVIGLERHSEINEPRPSLDKFFVDTGAASAKDSPVKVGDVAVFDRPFADLGGRVAGKAFDDRVGVAVLIDTLNNLESSPHELYFVFTAQEEMGTRGAGPAAYGIEPEVALALDVTGTSDTPNYRVRNAIVMGGGAAIGVKDPMMISDPTLVDALVRTAKKSRLPHQIEVTESGSTDARAIQISGMGARAAVLSVPCRYIHSPSEMADLTDIQNTVKLLTAFLKQTDM